ncbi:Carbonic AnHydrase [Chamberlinius hualienensis]
MANVKSLLIFLTVICCFLANVDGAGYSNKFWVLESNWSYTGKTGPAYWCKLGYKNCCGKSQSPIRLTSKDLDHDSDKINMKYYSQMPQKIRIKNNADTVRLEVDFRSKVKVPTTTFEDLKIKYVLDNIHFHWGSNSKVGSEHVIDGKRFPLEAHFVHRDSKYSTSDEASLHPNGVLVLSVLFKGSKNHNTHLRGLIADLIHVKYAGQTYNDTAPFVLSKILPPLKDGSGYYTYKGSFTTPPCTEGVRWVIFKERVPISELQMQAFRTLQTRQKLFDPLKNHPLVNNYRPSQKLNDRTVSWALLPDKWK